MKHHVRHLAFGGIAACLVALSGCTTTQTTFGAAGIIAAGAATPTSTLEQTYYLGVFDEQGQLPTTIYRVRVQGQASFLSQMSFGSGWVPAVFADSLAGQITTNLETGQAGYTLGADQAAPGQLPSALQTGRGLMMFGPEGFRRAPRDHRLVIVMGSSPQKFFQAVDDAFGTLHDLDSSKVSTDLNSKIMREFLTLQQQERELDQIELSLAEIK